MDCLKKEGVKQLAAIRQFIGGILYVSFRVQKSAVAKRKAMENNNHLEYS
jgi:hypothetical protein